MDKIMLKTMLFGLIAGLASMPLHAQTANENSDDTVAKVETDGGVIMIADGGEFQTAIPEQRVKSKARLMVSEESSATVVYDDGCKQKYDEPGVYEISATCVLPILWTAGATKGWMISGAIVGAAILLSTVDDGNGPDTRPPVSR